jgi:hypothetical protein
VTRLRANGTPICDGTNSVELASEDAADRLSETGMACRPVVSFKTEIETLPACRLQTQPEPVGFRRKLKKTAAKTDHFCKLVFD